MESSRLLEGDTIIHMNSSTDDGDGDDKVEAEVDKNANATIVGPQSGIGVGMAADTYMNVIEEHKDKDIGSVIANCDKDDNQTVEKETDENLQLDIEHLPTPVTDQYAEFSGSNDNAMDNQMAEGEAQMHLGMGTNNNKNAVDVLTSEHAHDENNLPLSCDCDPPSISGSDGGGDDRDSKIDSLGGERLGLINDDNFSTDTDSGEKKDEVSAGNPN